MEIESCFIEGLKIISPKLFGDSRGYFFESYNAQAFNKFVSTEFNFVQDNESYSMKNVLRGLHFQSPPFAQGKLVRVVQGKVLDVALDIRKNSRTYGEYFKIELSAENKKMFWIPPGFAHGFVVLEDNTIFQYKCTDFYNPNAEGSILWNDPNLSIDWQVDEPIISDKDKNGILFCNFASPF